MEPIFNRLAEDREHVKISKMSLGQTPGRQAYSMPYGDLWKSMAYLMKSRLSRLEVSISPCCRCLVASVGGSQNRTWISCIDCPCISKKRSRPRFRKGPGPSTGFDKAFPDVSRKVLSFKSSKVQKQSSQSEVPKQKSRIPKF